jgi:hypothetical protein
MTTKTGASKQRKTRIRRKNLPEGLLIAIDRQADGRALRMVFETLLPM